MLDVNRSQNGYFAIVSVHLEMTSSNPVGFGLSDIMTRIAPGLVWILGLVFLADINGDTINLPESSIANIILISFIAFVLGEANHLIRGTIRPIPPHFRRVIYGETGDTKYLGPIQKFFQERYEPLDSDYRRFHPAILIGGPMASVYHHHPRRRLIDDLENQYDIETEDMPVVDLYILVSNSVGSGMSQQTSRYHDSYLFTVNIIWSFVIWGLIYTLISYGMGSLEPLILLFVLIVLFSPLLVSYLIYGNIQEKYVDSLISEYFVGQTPSQV